MVVTFLALRKACLDANVRVFPLLTDGRLQQLQRLVPDRPSCRRLGTSALQYRLSGPHHAERRVDVSQKFIVDGHLARSLVSTRIPIGIRQPMDEGDISGPGFWVVRASVLVP